MIELFYERVPGYFDFPDVYRHAVQWLPDGGTFVEVGCWQGQSLAFLLVEAANSGKRLRVFGCDHFIGSVDACHGIKSVGAHCMHHLRRAGYPFSLIHADSTAGAGYFGDGSIDYLFIDAGHLYHEVKADLQAWIPKVRPGGIAAGHDFNHADVERAVREEFPGRDIEHLGATSWTWGSCWRVQL